MNKLLSLACLALVVLTACSSTITGSSASPEADSAVAETSTQPDSGQVETSAPDAANADVAVTDSAPVDVVTVDDRADVATDADASIVEDAAPDVSVDASDTDAGIVEDAAPIDSSFEIEPYEMPASINLVPLPGNRSLFASFRGRVRGENATMHRLRVPIHGLSASVRDVMVSSREGESFVHFHGVAVPTVSTDPHVDVYFTEPIHFVRDEWRTFWIGAMLNPIQARSSVTPGTPGAFSGAHIQMGLEAGETGGSWETAYASSFNAEVVGDDSHAYLYAPGRTTYGNYMVVRRSRPRVSVIPPVSDDLIHVGTPNVLYDWEMEAEGSGGSLSWKKMTYVIETDGDISLSEFQLVRDGHPVPYDRYEIVDGTNQDLRGLMPLSSRYVTIRWSEEDVIESGMRHTYRLIALPRGGTTGNTIRTTPLRSGHALPGTGWMTPDTYGLSIGGSDVAGPSLIEMVEPTGSTATVSAAFLWSDLSELPHVASPYPLGSSDWTDDGLVDDLVATYVRYAP